MKTSVAAFEPVCLLITPRNRTRFLPSQPRHSKSVPNAAVSLTKTPSNLEKFLLDVDISKDFQEREAGSQGKCRRKRHKLSAKDKKPNKHKLKYTTAKHFNG